MRRLHAGLVVLGVAAVLALASQAPDSPAWQCRSCVVDFTALRDLLVGVGLLAGLVWALYWLESVPVSKVVLHLAGVAAAVALVFAVAGP